MIHYNFRVEPLRIEEIFSISDGDDLRDACQHYKAVLDARMVIWIGKNTKGASWPADWWQALKDRWFPIWAKRRWPVRWRSRSFRAVMFFPQITIPEPFGTPVFHVEEICDADLYGENHQDHTVGPVVDPLGLEQTEEVIPSLTNPRSHS